MGGSACRSALKRVRDAKENEVLVNEEKMLLLEKVEKWKTINRCMESGVVPEDLKAACIVPYTKGKVMEENSQIIEE